VVQGSESIRTFAAGNFAARRRDDEQTHLGECVDIIDGPIARHLVCLGWVGFKKLHAAASNTRTTG
jgi:hypothetical protein